MTARAGGSTVRARLGAARAGLLACLWLAGCTGHGAMVADAAVDAVVPADANLNPCRLAGGICLAGVVDCVAGQGTLAPSGDEGCVFDNGNGVCCVPPGAAASGDTTGP